MKQTLTYILSFLFTLNGLAQVNLVPNGSFEEYSSCPSGSGQLETAVGWFNPNLFSPDYFNICSSSSTIAIPGNSFGFQSPRTGNAYGGIYTFINDTIACEYIQTKLTEKLKANREYCIEFYVSLSDSASLYSMNMIGIYFSTTQIQGGNDRFLYIPQVVNPSSNNLANKIDWIKISGSFIATGGEEYLTIGNFNQKGQDDTTFVGGGYHFLTDKYCYFYIDDVSLIDCDSLNGPIKFYPNPTSGLFYIEKPALQIGTVELYNLQGQLLQSIILPKGITKTEVDLSSYSNGLYLCRMLYENGTTESHKVIVQH